MPITATVTIDGDEITADLTESAPMVRGLAQLHALVHPGLRLPGGPLRADGRDPEHLRRVPADPRADEAGHGRRGRDAGRVVDARRHRLPRARRGQRRARAADPRPRAGRRRGRQHARDLRRRPARRRRPVHLLRAGRRHLGRHADLGRQRRPHEPGEPGREHPGRGGRVGVPDRHRALRARARQRRRRPAPRRPRGRARLAVPDAEHVADRPLRPGRPPAVRPRGRRPRRAVDNVLLRPDGTEESCPRCSRPRSTRATSTSTARRAAAAGATRSSATPRRSRATSRTGRSASRRRASCTAS